MTMAGILVALGIVFGDIGTSPLYVMKAIAGVNPAYDADYILGAVSCVIWTLTLQTTVKYVLIALHADNRGEGGIMALYALLRGGKHRWIYIVCAVGAAALIADGVITPAITVTSAVEGLRMISPDIPVLPIVVVIILLVFIMQQAGTHRIGRCFGPFMLLWYLALGVVGALNIPLFPSILKAFNPWYAVMLLTHYPGWFLILGAVFLCTTGAEALYSDLGHCGRRNISVSWLFVKIMLILTYLGQGAWLLANQGDLDGRNPFYAVLPSSMIWLAVLMSTGAAIIASQALLSGSFTIFSEAMGLDFWPRMRIKYPSVEKGQLYIPAVNWALLAGCLLTVLIFRDSSRMEAAYGLAITITMIMTTILLAFWMRSRNVSRVWCVLFIAGFGLLEAIFFVANAFKFMHGGWYSLLIAGGVLAVMVIWRNASLMKARFVEFRPLEDYLPVVKGIKEDTSIPKYASNLVYLSRSRDPDMIETKLMYSIINKHPKRADHYWFVHVEPVDAPDALEYSVKIVVPQTVYVINMRIGFRVDPTVTLYLRQIVEDLSSDGRLDLTSTYPSLRKHGIPGDFRFVIIHRLFSTSSNCRKLERSMMKIHGRLSRICQSDKAAYGLETSTVTLEYVPLIINTSPRRRITPSGD